ncbi:MAG TPA: hypothetical protein VLR93_06670, partial [Patescibacteria group bacterium]|nr:hypothetical protein [Patescibacteria group bacterium]
MQANGGGAALAAAVGLALGAVVELAVGALLGVDGLAALVALGATLGDGDAAPADALGLADPVALQAARTMVRATVAPVRMQTLLSADRDDGEPAGTIGPPAERCRSLLGS